MMPYKAVSFFSFLILLAISTSLQANFPAKPPDLVKKQLKSSAQISGFKITRRLIRQQSTAKNNNMDALNPDSPTARQLRQYLKNTCLYHHSYDEKRRTYHEWVVFQPTGSFYFANNASLEMTGTWETFFSPLGETMLVLKFSGENHAINLVSILAPDVINLGSESRNKLYQRMFSSTCQAAMRAELN